MIVSALIFVLVVELEAWTPNTVVALDTSAIGNTTISPVDPIEQLREIVEEHTRAIASLRQELIRCESGKDSLILPPGYIIGHDDAIKTHHITFKRTFVEPPSVIFAVKKAVDDSVTKPIWYHLWYNGVKSTGFQMNYMLRPITTTKPTSTYALTIWMACGH